MLVGWSCTPGRASQASGRPHKGLPTGTGTGVPRSGSPGFSRAKPSLVQPRLLVASLFLVAMPFVPSSVIAPSSRARSPEPLVASLNLAKWVRFLFWTRNSLRLGLTISNSASEVPNLTEVPGTQKKGRSQCETNNS